MWASLSTRNSHVDLEMQAVAAALVSALVSGPLRSRFHRNEELSHHGIRRDTAPGNSTSRNFL
jgi:hypothetical protein